MEFRGFGGIWVKIWGWHSGCKMRGGSWLAFWPWHHPLYILHAWVHRAESKHMVNQGSFTGSDNSQQSKALNQLYHFNVSQYIKKFDKNPQMSLVDQSKTPCMVPQFLIAYWERYSDERSGCSIQDTRGYRLKYPTPVLWYDKHAATVQEWEAVVQLFAMTQKTYGNRKWKIKKLMVWLGVKAYSWKGI